MVSILSFNTTRMETENNTFPLQENTGVLSSAIEQNFEECNCTEFLENDDGYTLVLKKTGQRHSKKAALNDAFRSEMALLLYMLIPSILHTVVLRYLMNDDAESNVIQKSGSGEVLARQSDLPVLDISPMPFDNMFV
ncbi:hypothetical protein PHYBLDRAFT_167653 [Phycomyces blakesleeanus NRRL 1555(-)]|uniref:Uncharacterized protein n=1 Tax=Phycomyces blakesleeanus (strain ATCC 8743b / DSM 1359 / FGSC 10004 / NBRC 33097 / NRRL 1555) TaxID=763407 RepID=A0A167MW50_PHYB8|nr:hypothetical protein PHYBLDRAFT_167653 [Phycomyces blakesleeanus NRRL 1555(-)]OAD74229.1 hypothetical protein PHYBLDRAFT_167653 [Phycomyces blakesleeanus NRRL 1555(-)]|eukprot:XP_018292269.1 hypothetical protein PHYBLDRAFT_167653 [Phycomyces blakesleeanus NRRL 1555(-)]